MIRKPSLAKNTLYSAISSFSNVLIMVLVIISARILGDKAFGEFSFALAIASVFEMLIDLGFFTLITRNVARDVKLSEEYLSNILGWKVILSVISMCLLVVTVNLLDKNRDAQISAYILGAAIVLRTYKTTSVAFFQAYERFDLVVLTTYIERVGVLVCCIGVLYIQNSVIAFSMAYALWRIPDLLISYWLLNKYIAPVKITFNKALIKTIQIAAIPFALYGMATVMYNYIGTLALSAMRSPEEVGWYNAASKIYEGLIMFPFLLSSALMPRLSRLFTDNFEEYALISQRVLRFLALIVLLITITVGIMAPQVIELLFGKAYIHAITSLKILLFAAIFMFMNFIINTILISANKEKTVLKITSLGLAVMTASNIILVNLYGINGAAVSVVISEISISIMLLFAMRKYLFRIPVYNIAWKPLIAGSAVTGLLYLYIPFKSFPGAAIFAILYIISLYILKAFTKDDIAMLINMLPANNKPLD